LLLLLPAIQSSCDVDSGSLQINFHNATLVRSNLGGVGGRCSIAGACEEQQTASTPHEIYISQLGSACPQCMNGN
jgi:hypothetical protein